MTQKLLKQINSVSHLQTLLLYQSVIFQQANTQIELLRVKIACFYCCSLNIYHSFRNNLQN